MKFQYAKLNVAEHQKHHEYFHTSMFFLCVVTQMTGHERLRNNRTHFFRWKPNKGIELGSQRRHNVLTENDLYLLEEGQILKLVTL